MQSLNTALSYFIEQQDLYNEANGLFSNHDLRPRKHPVQPEVDKRIPLSPELQYLYSHYEMIDAKAEGTLKMKSAAVEIGDAALLFFPAPEHLHRQQLGFRWIGMQEPYDESDTWPSHHIVIANLNDDPVIVDAGEPDSPVYVAFEGGEPALAADSLADFFTAIGILIEHARLFAGEVKDEETFETKPEYLIQIQPKLEELLGQEHTARLLEYLSI
ncbi:hypothetical protein PAECIP112173_02409 [Paenibacillus sp. JJ-100]|uniref:hypothetical protein n=1 Tax=Paenibacillus sp. JJ-100 TaxID=2974896 RepID=UPI0022FF8865|nr:hypothetical protein [Paenibacillus sp. JJ-100]CAI6076122.1 hypothetical protein PAECIP112173_02409 [Paenibacillus sp. JJ-100]